MTRAAIIEPGPTLHHASDKQVYPQLKILKKEQTQWSTFFFSAVNDFYVYNRVIQRHNFCVCFLTLC